MAETASLSNAPHPLRIDHSNTSIKFRAPLARKIFAGLNNICTERLANPAESDNDHIVRGVAAAGYAKSTTEEDRGEIKAGDCAKHKGYG